MIKRVLSVTMLLVLGGVLLFATGSGEQTAESTAPKTLRFLHFEHSPETQQLFEKQAREFEKSHPYVTVEIEYGTSDEYFTKLAAEIKGGNPPDVAQTMQEHLLALAATDNLRVLDKLLDKVGRTRFSSLASVGYRGKSYGVPTQSVTWALWVRQDRLDQEGLSAPVKWSDMLVAASKLTVDQNGDGNPEYYGLSLPYSTISQTTEYFVAHLWLNDWYLFDEKLQSALAAPRAIEAMEYYRKLKQYTPPSMATVNYAELGQSYGTGLSSMVFYPGRITEHIERNKPEIGNVTRAVAPPYNRAKATWIWPKMYVIPKSAKNPELAEEYVNFLMKTENIAALSNTVPVHSIPPVKDVLEDSGFLANAMNAKYKEAVKVEMGLLQFAKNPSQEHSGVVNPYYGAFVGTNILTNAVQKVMVEDVEPRVALETAASQMNEFLAKAK
ncbi:MAG: extracellular solute-binding protein [Planctomycetes bacterium]|nr:extracellular solute-binding protein [Planctomycetota bacterium]